MADYSNILPEDFIILSRTPTDSGFAPRSWEHANLTIDENGDVRLTTRTHHAAGEGIPVEECNQRTLVYTLASSECRQCALDTKRLREDLAEGGRLAVLLEWVIAGHSVEWDGNNYVGHLTEDATEASYELQQVGDYASDVDVWNPRDWLMCEQASAETALTSLGIWTTASDTEIDDLTNRLLAEAESNNLVFDGGRNAVNDAIRDLIEDAQQAAYDPT